MAHNFAGSHCAATRTILSVARCGVLIADAHLARLAAHTYWPRCAYLTGALARYIMESRALQIVLVRCFALGCCTAVPASALADTIRLFAIADAMTSEANPNTNYGSNTALLVGESQGQEWRYYVRWNIGGAPALAGATINSVRIDMARACSASTNGPLQILIGRISSSWSETSATWSNPPHAVICSTLVYSVPGCSGFGDVVFPDSNNCFRNHVQAVVDGAAEHFGFSFEPVNPVGYQAYRSREQGDAPELVIDYTPAPPATHSIAVTVAEATGGCPRTGEVNALQLFRDGSFMLEIADPGCSHSFTNLADGHDYRVDAYVNDMLAGQAFVNGLTSNQNRMIHLAARVSVDALVRAANGITPLDGASVELRSHEGIAWRHGVVGPSGDVVWNDPIGGSESDVALVEPAQVAGEFWNVVVLASGQLVGSSVLPEPMSPGGSFAAAIVASTAVQLPQGEWTVVVHGRINGSSYDSLLRGWMGELGERIRLVDPNDAFVVSVDQATYDLHRVVNGQPEAQPVASVDPSKHYVLLFDWTKSADNLGIADDGFAYAAAEALESLLDRWGAADKVHCLVGHSRGAVVASETARRLLERNRPPRQVLFVDGEGFGAFYRDDVFDAWSGAGNPATLWRNVFSMNNDCKLGLPILGGSVRIACENMNVADDYTHCDIPQLLVAFMDVRTGLLTLPGSVEGGAPYDWSPPTGVPRAPLDPDSPEGRLRRSPFNGDFAWLSSAGWSSHGGVCDGVDPPIAGYARLTSTGHQLTHQAFMIPTDARYVRCRTRLFTPDFISGDDTLRLRIRRVRDGSNDAFLVREATGQPTAWAYSTFTLANGFAGEVCTVSFELNGGPTGVFSTVDVDDLQIFADLPCSGDLTGDGQVTSADLALLLSSWGPCAANGAPCAADISGDGMVGSVDLAFLLSAWGPCPR